MLKFFFSRFLKSVNELMPLKKSRRQVTGRNYGDLEPRKKLRKTQKNHQSRNVYKY